MDLIRERLAALPLECIGPERLLSRALYRCTIDMVQLECIGRIFQLSTHYGRDVVLRHLVLLPEEAYQWILGGFERALEEQEKLTGSDLILGPFPYFTVDGTSGYGSQVLAPKIWAKDFLADAIQTRPLPLLKRHHP
uniref:hypothetical protein n=1 Tax=Prosthecobacter sp. TaxID=1965333 RepID=UPI003783CD23